MHIDVLTMVLVSCLKYRYMRSATAIVTSPSHNQGSNITWCPVITDPPLPQPPYHPQGGRIRIAIVFSIIIVFIAILIVNIIIVNIIILLVVYYDYYDS